MKFAMLVVGLGEDAMPIDELEQTIFFFLGGGHPSVTVQSTFIS